MKYKTFIQMKTLQPGKMEPDNSGNAQTLSSPWARSHLILLSSTQVRLSRNCLGSRISFWVGLTQPGDKKSQSNAKIIFVCYQSTSNAHVKFSHRCFIKAEKFYQSLSDSNLAVEWVVDIVTYWNWRKQSTFIEWILERWMDGYKSYSRFILTDR